MQSIEPLLEVNCPEAQRSQTEEPGKEACVPAAQTLHPEEIVACISNSENCPGSQFSHMKAATEDVFPAAQPTQPTEAELDLNLPAWQSMHVVDDARVENLPDLQALHRDDLGIS